jgi:hypothetical protein
MKSTDLLRQFARVSRNVARLAVFLGACTVLPPAGAQGSSTPITSLDVSPVVAAPGVPRTLTIRFVAGCNLGAAVVGQPNPRNRTVSVRLNLSHAMQCDALMLLTATVQVTPDAEGDLRVLVVTSDGTLFGETIIRTRAPASNRSQVDLTGMWYDPSTVGSGLTFMHASTGSDQVFGTWYLYDNQGNPRWFTIQGVQWTAGGTVATGTLYETGANSVVCLPPFTGCPVALATIGPRGFVSIIIDGPNSARITAVTSNGGATISSNLIRSVF